MKLSYLLISRTEPLGARLPDFRFLYVTAKHNAMNALALLNTSKTCIFHSNQVMQVCHPTGDTSDPP